MKFFEFPGTGLGTVDAKLAAKHVAAGHAMREIVVPRVTLADVLAGCDGEVHWLKIDVEGAELQVLQGWEPSKVRPWIVLVESTLPLTQAESHKPWEPLLVRKGYKFAYFDGLNRFYVSDEHPELLQALRCGANVFDEYVLERHRKFDDVCRPERAPGAHMDAQREEATRQPPARRQPGSRER